MSACSADEMQWKTGGKKNWEELGSRRKAPYSLDRQKKVHVHRSTKWVTNLLVQKIKDWQEILKRQKTSTLITALWYTNLLVISNPMRFRSKHKKNYIINPPKFPNCNKHTGHKPHFWVFFPNMIWMTSFFSMHDLNDLDPSSAIWFFVPLPPPAFPADCVSKTHLQKRKKVRLS